MKYVKYLVVVPAVVLLFSVAAFSEEPGTAAKPEVKSAMTPTSEAAEHVHGMGTEKRVVATMDADGVQRVEIVGGEYYYDPNYIVVKVNKPVELTVKKAPGYVPHDMVVQSPEAGINFKVDLDDKKPEKIKFTPTKVGKYEMYCDKKLLFFKSHRERGMHGMIEVVE